MTGKNVILLAIAVASDNFAAGMGSTALVALFMRLVNKQFTATQFSILVAIASIPLVFSGPIAALVQMKIGWVGLYQVSFFLALGFLPFLVRMRDPITAIKVDEEPLKEFETSTRRVEEQLSGTP